MSPIRRSVWRTLAPQEQEPLESGPRPVVPALPRHVLARIPVGGIPEVVAATDEAVWVASRRTGTVSRLDPATNRVVATISGLATANALVVGEGMVWVAGDARIWRIDPASDRVTASFPVGGIPDSVAAAADTVLVSFVDGQDVARVDPATNQVTARVPVGSDPPEVAVGARGAWVTNPQTDTVDRLDPHATR